MRKLLIFVAALLISGSLLAGGLVTNTNQSALFTRLQNRNASTGIDAVYYNPAGLTKLGDGFYLSLNNQTIGQTKTVGNNYNYLLGSHDYVGNVSAPIYPGVYAAFVTGKLAFSAGFNPVGGGGGATYKKGLPSFETQVADLVPSLNSQGMTTTQYSADIFFEGTSVYFGYQANASYKVNDMVSLAAGVRLVSAKNTYNGHLRNIMVNPNYPAFGATGGMMLASTFFATGQATLTGLATSATTAASSLSTMISSGAAPATTPVSALPAATAAGITQLLGAAGISTAGMNIGTAAATLNAVAPGFTDKANTMGVYSNKTADMEVDAEQTGTGVTPIISVNITPSENLNIAVKYEFKTNLDLTTSVPDPAKGGGIFVDGKKVIADMPAMLAAGVEYKPVDKLSIAASMNMYFDKDVDYDGSPDVNINMIDKNFLEYGLGVEYGLSEKLRASIGWVATSTSVNDAYQNDQRYSTNTNSFGAGIGYRITPMIDLNLGGQYTFYAEGSKDYTHNLGGNPIPVTETYNKKTWIVGVGLDFYFGKE